MEKLEATYRIVTPMFLGGAKHEATSIRPPSVKGVLRFWWRALNWARFRKGAADDTAALIKLHKEENLLFGNAAEEENGEQVGGQGCFLMTVKHRSVTPTQPAFQGFPGKAYLAGMGLRNREAIPSDEKFEIVLLFRRGTDSAFKESMKETFRIIGLLGGFGSRSRRGFGSVVKLVKEQEQLRLPTESEINTEIEWLKSKFTTIGISPFSVLDINSLLYKATNDYNSACEAMEAVGRQMNLYRTNGTSVIRDRNGNVTRTALAGQRIINAADVPISGLQFFRTDHNSAHNTASTGSIIPPNNVSPQRAIFGLPHPYRFSSLNGRRVNYDFIPVWQEGNKKGRRSSPVFIHVTTYTNDADQVRYRPLLLLLQAKFLPNNAQLEVSVDGSSIGNVPSPTNYVPISNFLSANFKKC